MGGNSSKNIYKQNITEIIENLHLNTSNDNLMLKNRFLEQVLYYERKRDRVKVFYNIFRFIVTTGSILLPALLSVGQMDPSKLPRNFESISYWFSWGISLSVTASNGFLQLFVLDKNYFTYSIVTEQLKTEGWQFFQLSGKYDQFDEHIECYKLFCKSIEGIKRKQVEQEFSSGKADTKKSYKKLNPDNTVSLINNPQPPPEIQQPVQQQPVQQQPVQQQPQFQQPVQQQPVQQQPQFQQQFHQQPQTQSFIPQPPQIQNPIQQTQFQVNNSIPPLNNSQNNAMPPLSNTLVAQLSGKTNEPPPINNDRPNIPKRENNGELTIPNMEHNIQPSIPKRDDNENILNNE